MSVQIFYDIRALRVPGNAVGREEDVYLLCFLSGDSRTYTYSGQRERKWTTPIIGSYDDVFAHQLTWCAYETYWKTNGASGAIRDHQWLTKVRKALDSAHDVRECAWDAEQSTVDELTLKPFRRCDGMTFRQAVENSMALRAVDPNPGNSDWNVFRITGPGEN